MDHLVLILGLALVGVAMLQFGLWTGRGLRLRHLESKRFELEMEKLRAEIFQLTRQRADESTTDSDHTVTKNAQSKNAPLPAQAGVVDEQGNWKGFRSFVVAKLVRETKNCTSIYFAPADGKAIVDYKPGQHITVRLNLPAQAKPIVRCYTLSDHASGQLYRISVKRVPSPSDSNVPDGLVSSWINSELCEGQRVELKAPSGSFFLQPGDAPVVLLAGGIGITPMLAMMNAIATEQPQRESLLFYGIRDSEDHTFKRYIKQLSEKHENINAANFYSQPLSTDRVNDDYHVEGYVKVDLLKKILPSPNFDFYLCGPPPFMNAIHAGLLDWGVPESRIRYEAFGPASICKSKPAKHVPSEQSDVIVGFSRSQTSATWDGSHDSLLELMEENEITVDSGCRAGSCGTCQTRILKGHVTYDDPEMVECEPNHCLPCIAKPIAGIELDA